MPRVIHCRQIGFFVTQMRLKHACFLYKCGYLLQTHISASPSIHHHPIWNGSLTMEWNTTPCSIFASPILCHAFIRPCVFLLEIRDFKDGVWILHFDFAGERDAAGSPPAYLWDRAAQKKKKTDKEKVPMVASVSRSDQSLIKHREKRGWSEKALWVIVPYKSNCDFSDFQSS